MKAGFRLHEAGVGSSDGANRGTSAERRSDQRSRDSGRADDHGSGGTDRHRAGRYRSAKSAAAAAAGAAGGLLRHRPGAVCAGFLREVLRCLLEGVRWLRSGGTDLALADKSAITKARARLGTAPLRELFAR